MMLVDVKKLKEIINPIENPPWKEINSKISYEEILNSKEIEISKEYDALNPITREQHIAKIAHFVKNGWNDEPITIVFNKDLYPIYDGNHRFCAAILRNDDYVFANVEGSREMIKKISY